jgi:hypothetical protein
MRRPGNLLVCVPVLILGAALAACAQDAFDPAELDPAPVARTSTLAQVAAGGVIDALAATADADGRVQAVLAVSAITPVGNGLARVDARWEGRLLVGLMEGDGSGPTPDHLRVEGTVVAARGVSAFTGVSHATDGTSNTVLFLAIGAHLGSAARLSYHIEDILVSSLALHASDHLLMTTASGSPFAAAVVRGPGDASVLPQVVTFGAPVQVIQTPLGPIGTVSGPAGIIAVLIGL